MRRSTRLLINKLKKKKYRGFEIKMIEFLENECINYAYEPDRYSVTVQVTKTYIPDFKIESRASKASESDIYLELKGRLTLENRKKYKAIKQEYPWLDLRFVFQKPNNPIRKGSKTTYAMWAEKNGFPWCGPEIKKEWLKEMCYR